MGKKRVMKWAEIDITSSIQDAMPPERLRAILGSRASELSRILAEFTWYEHEEGEDG